MMKNLKCMLMLGTMVTLLASASAMPQLTGADMEADAITQATPQNPPSKQKKDKAKTSKSKKKDKKSQKGKKKAGKDCCGSSCCKGASQGQN